MASRDYLHSSLVQTSLSSTQMKPKDKYSGKPNYERGQHLAALATHSPFKVSKHYLTVSQPAKLQGQGHAKGEESTSTLPSERAKPIPVEKSPTKRIKAGKGTKSSSPSRGVAAGESPNRGQFQEFDQKIEQIRQKMKSKLLLQMPESEEKRNEKPISKVRTFIKPSPKRIVPTVPGQSPPKQGPLPSKSPTKAPLKQRTVRPAPQVKEQKVLKQFGTANTSPTKTLRSQTKAGVFQKPHLVKKDAASKIRAISTLSTTVSTQRMKNLFTSSATLKVPLASSGLCKSQSANSLPVSARASKLPSKKIEVGKTLDNIINFSTLEVPTSTSKPKAPVSKVASSLSAVRFASRVKLASAAGKPLSRSLKRDKSSASNYQSLPNQKSTSQLKPASLLKTTSQTKLASQTISANLSKPTSRHLSKIQALEKIEEALILNLKAKTPKQGDLQQFKEEFTRITTHNRCETTIKKGQFGDILICLGIIFHPKLCISGLRDLASQHPLVDLLWLILSEHLGSSSEADANDTFRILVAILAIKDDSLVMTQQESTAPTKNPLLLRRQYQGTNELVFVSENDLKKFRLKFKMFKEDYYVNEIVRRKYLKSMKVEDVAANTKQQQVSQGEAQRSAHRQLDVLKQSHEKKGLNTPKAETENKIQTPPKTMIVVDMNDGVPPETKTSPKNPISTEPTVTQTEPAEPSISIALTDPVAQNYETAPHISTSPKVSTVPTKAQPPLRIETNSKVAPAPKVENSRKISTVEHKSVPPSPTASPFPVTIAPQNTELVSSILGNVYQNSLTKYDKISSQLERTGSTIHLKANISFRKSILSPLEVSGADDDEVIQQMRVKIRQVQRVATRLTLGSSNSFLEEQDDQILAQYTPEEINSVLKDPWPKAIPEKSISPIHKKAAACPDFSVPRITSQQPEISKVVPKHIEQKATTKREKEKQSRPLSSKGKLQVKQTGKQPGKQPVKNLIKDLAKSPAKYPTKQPEKQQERQPARQPEKQPARQVSKVLAKQLAERRSKAPVIASSNPFLSGLFEKKPKEKVDLSKEELLAKLKQELVDKRAPTEQLKVNLTKSEYHNKKVKQGNQRFAERLKNKVKGYESSESSDEESEQSQNQARLMVINFDLGSKGYQVFRGLTNQDPALLAIDFCRKHGLGLKVRAKVEKMIVEKKKFIEGFDIQEK